MISNKTMRRSDAAMIASGVHGKELMLRAGSAIFSHCQDMAHPVAILCGKGNNAGDGYVLAMLMKQAGENPTLILAEDAFSDDGRYYFDLAKEVGVSHLIWDSSVDLSDYRTLVDCLFGTGFRGVPSGVYADIIRKINETGQSGAEVLSVDIPSGLSGDSGMGELCVHADKTFSIGTPKTGHFLGMAKDFVGELVNLDIGIPITGEVYRLVTSADFGSVIRERKNVCNKGDFGYIAVMGGCRDYSGATKLANLSMSALRSGCGVAKLIVPESISAAVSPYLLESTLVALPDEGGFMAFNPDAIDRGLNKVRAIALGMGWGQGGGNAEILRYILQNYALPLVIDADGLNLLAKIGVDLLKSTKCRPILTPHLMEFERLSGISRKEVLQNPIQYAKDFAERYHVTLLLKGATTVVTDGDTVYLIDRGCPGMATAGSGDVLSGILAGILGYSSDDLPLTAACGAWINGRAGEIAQQETNSVSMTASDTVKAIPKAISEILSCNHQGKRT
ncbi:MAG: NAD(P)H-hydrate dehydratase [Eubacteriales bacterium]